MALQPTDGENKVFFNDVTGQYHLINIDPSGGSQTDLGVIAAQKSHHLEIAKDNVEGHFSINKFGRNIEIDSGITADVWDGGHKLASGGTSLMWVAPTAAAKHNIVSDDPGDIGGGAGAKTIKIYGLPDWDTAEITEVLTMDGTDAVETSNEYVIIHRMKVVTKGATSANIGNITATAKAPSATTVTARIRPGVGQTLMAVLGVPSCQRAFMGLYYGSMNKAGGASGLADLAVLYNPEPGVEGTNYLHKQTMGIQSVGSSSFVHPFYTPKKFTGPGIIKIHVHSGVNDVDISAGFDVILVNN